MFSQKYSTNFHTGSNEQNSFTRGDTKKIITLSEKCIKVLENHWQQKHAKGWEQQKSLSDCKRLIRVIEKPEMSLDHKNFNFMIQRTILKAGQVRRQAPYGDAVYNLKSEESEGGKERKKQNCVVDNVSHKIIQMPSLTQRACMSFMGRGNSFSAIFPVIKSWKFRDES